MEEKRKADNQFARNFFFVEHVYKETRTMVNDPRFSKKKKHWSFKELLLQVFVKFPTDWIFHAVELHLSK